MFLSSDLMLKEKSRGLIWFFSALHPLLSPCKDNKDHNLIIAAYYHMVFNAI